MSKHNIEAIYPLSPLQQGFLFHALYAPESEDYFEQLNCMIQGSLNVGAFVRSWQQVIDRHPILRTAFLGERRDKPLQVVRPRVAAPFEQQDWRTLSEEEQQERLEQLLRADRRSGFKLSVAPLMRLMLIRMGQNRYQFVWSSHHLLLDGWSFSLVLKEVFAYYGAYSEERELEMERSRPFRDYIAWLQQQEMAKVEGYWREKLKGFFTPTRLGLERNPADLSGPAHSRSEHTVWLSEEMTAGLQRLARQQQLTLNTLVQGAWALLLSRYSGECDVLFGTVVSGRPASLPGVEQMVGLFINTLPFRVRIELGQRVTEWLKGLQEQQVEMRQYEYSPLVEVQGWSDVPRGVSLFDSILVFENYPVQKALQERKEELKISNLRFVEKTNYPITVAVVPGGELSLRISYADERYEGETIRRMVGHFQTLLEGMADKPEQLVSHLSLLTKAEQEQFKRWNNIATDDPSEACVHQLFEAQAERTPDALALSCGEQHLTYLELNSRANQLAHHLRGLGVGPEIKVGLLIERSVEMVVSLLAIFKAGGVYVPMDPSYPQERLSFMLADAAIEILLTQSSLTGKAVALQGRVVCLDEQWEEIAQESTENPTVEVRPEHLAYIIYTSGSMGQPKGVLVEHRELAHTIRASQDAFKFNAQDTMPCLASFSFDIFLFELLNPLVAGGRSLLLAQGEALEASSLLKMLDEVTCLHAVPSLMRHVVTQAKEHKGAAGYKKMRRVFIGGEAVAAELLVQIEDVFEQAEVHVLYGPTEATIICGSYGVSDARRVSGQMLGRALGNNVLQLRDWQHQLTPVGVAGEIYIGGAGVTRGYLNREKLTAEKYVSIEGERYYRSGDVGRYLQDGNLEFLGRIDEQVKVRGYRIELGEIEAALKASPRVRETVVIAREDIPGDKRLVAYVVAEDHTPSDTQTADGARVVRQQDAVIEQALREHLKERLPEYMAPSAFVMLESLPLSPTGKVNRQALPAPGPARSDISAYVASRTTVEEMLCSIWAEVLGVEQVGIQDNFFELGGHSLLATQMVSRVREAFKVEASLRELFEKPTVAALAGRVEVALRAAQGVELPPLRAAERVGELPLSFSQQRLWFLDQLQSRSAFYNIPLALRINGFLLLPALQLSLSEIVRRHEVLRSRFLSSEGKPTLVIDPPSPISLPLLDLSDLDPATQQAEVERLIDAEAQLPFDLAAGPLMRVQLLRLAEDEHILLLSQHHIITDGWSMGILVREVTALYEAFSKGEESPLAELEIQYVDYAVWQQEWLRGEVLEEQLRYWREQLEGAPAVLEMATDRVRPAEQSYRGGTVEVEVSGEVSEGLEEISRREGVTLYMVLLAAYAVLLMRYSGQEDICIGSPSAGRTQTVLEGLIGFFVNTLVMRTDLSGNPGFRELLKRVREVTLGAYAHQDTPFEKLVEVLQPERSLSHTPLFQVWFVLQNAPIGELKLPDITLSQIEIGNGTAKFDLSLSLTEGPDGLKGIMEYDTALFDAETIALMIGHLEALLREVVKNPDSRLLEIPLQGEAEGGLKHAAADLKAVADREAQFTF
jgi:amino acid adenylation domain-containing protein